MRILLQTFVLLAALTFVSSAQDENQSVSGTPSRSTVPHNSLMTPVCPTKFDFHPEVDGIYRAGGDVKPPRPKRTKDATFSDEARRAMRDQHLSSFHAISLIGFTVTVKGKTQDLCVIKAAGYGLDENAMRAVAKWRFDPATKSGAPVAVRLSTEVDFKAY